jgi:hypothetical protein
MRPSARCNSLARKLGSIGIVTAPPASSRVHARNRLVHGFGDLDQDLTNEGSEAMTVGFGCMRNASFKTADFWAFFCF